MSSRLAARGLQFIAVALLAASCELRAQTRISSDFELQQMQQQLARSRDFLSQVSGHLNLGDVRATRNESALARAEYAKALDAATKERLDARGASNLTRYATATSYAALAEAKLGHAARAFELSEEALRYDSGSAKTWNLYASAMSLLGKPAKAASAARNAVAMERDPLDLAVYKHTLASALGDTEESERLLVEVTNSLRSEAFAPVRARIARHEAFESYSSARGDEAAYISLLIRSQLRLAALYEARGATDAARQQYQRVLEARSDDPTALAAMARQARSDEERERYYADAFDANPFSLTLIRSYRALKSPEGDSAGARMRRALYAMQHDQPQSARAQLDALAREFPDNDTLCALRREVDGGSLEFLRTKAQPTAADLRAVIARFDNLTAEERAALDATTFTSSVVFDALPFETGTIEGLPFKFSEPMVFNGTFGAHAPLRLTYRILGASGDALLLEPVRVEVAK
jgi:hypothetical protein